MAAKAKTFKSHGGGHVSIFVPWRTEPIEILEGQTYETADKRELEALDGSPECIQTKGVSRAVRYSDDNR